MACSKCRGSGWAGVDYCDCPAGAHLRAEGLTRRLSAAGVRKRFIGARLDAFDGPDDAGAAARAYVRHLGERDVKGLLVVGHVGVGKTWLAVAVLAALLEADGGITACYINAAEFFRDVHASMHDPDRYLEPLYRAARADVLLFDDVGKERMTEAKAEVLYNVLNGFYEAVKPLIITANLPLNAPLKELAERIGGVTGEAVASRLCEAATIIRYRGNDRRTGSK